jgi:hypothetical protein
MSVNLAALVRDVDFDFNDLGPSSSYCPHPRRARRIEKCTGRTYCIVCGDDVPHEVLAAEDAAERAASGPITPEMELPC